MRIYYSKPSITQKEMDYVNEAMKHGWGERGYEHIAKFEEKFKRHLGVKHAIATSSCTGALHMGLHAIGVRNDDEVILGDINWIASAASITYLGAKPVVVDVKQDTWCIDINKIEEEITEKTKAILAVHLYGNLCDMDGLLRLGQKYSIPIIEDSAEAIGSVYKGSRVGSIGKFGTFSFHGTKTITTGEGGMFVTNDDDLYERVLTLSNHGRSRTQTKQFWPDIIGFKYKMSNIQAALGCAQVDRINELISKKRQIFNWYKKKLSKLPLKMNPEPEDCINSYWMPTIVVDEGVDFNREDLLNEFKANNIDGRVFFWPLSLIGRDFFIKRKPTLVANSLYHRAVNLPSYHDLKEEEVERVIECIKKVLNGCF